MSNNLKRQLRAMFIGLSAVSSAWLCASSAAAGTDTADVQVSATVTANCTITAGALAFGEYDGVTANATSDLDAVGTLTVTCTNGSTGDIGLGQGLNADTGSTEAAPVRRMKDAADNFLSYALFQDAARTTVWGNTTATDVAHSGTGLSTNITIYGRVESGQNVPAGEYADTVVATITF